MKVRTTAIVVTLSLCLSGLALAQSGPNGSGGDQGLCAQALTDHLEVLPVGDFDDEEAAAVTFLREEEKLARDVYLMLSLSWDAPVFTKIARAEQKHMDLVAVLLDRHSLADPVVDDAVGEFSDPQLAALYQDLVGIGQQSLADAFFVGATIEDLDLSDLGSIRDLSDEMDVWLIVENLSAGSRNHLRAFAANLANLGLAYEAQYLDQYVVDEIVDSEFERGVVYDEFGDVLAECGNQGAQGGSGDATGSGGGGTGGGTGSGGSGGNGSGGSGSGTGDCDGTGPN